MRWLWSAVAVIGLSVFAIGTASGEPTQTPAPGPTSTSDELADMVLDAIQHGNPVAPTTTTPVPAPPR
jgi:hypothetical protein